MANITFSESSGVNNAVFGKVQAPIRMFIEKHAEAFEAASIIKDICAMEASNHWAEAYSAMTAMDDFAPVGENGEYPTTGMQEGYRKMLENVTWKNKFAITMEAVEDSQTMDLRKRPANFVASYYRTRERFVNALLGAALNKQTTANFGGKAFDTTSADGVCAFSAAHPSITKKTKNQSNIFQNAFSNDALIAAECAMQEFKGDNGEILAVSPDTIVIPNDFTLKKDVFAAIGADKDPATANNGFNYTYGRWTVIISAYLNQYLTPATRPWVLLDSTFNKEEGGLIWQERKALSVRSEIASNDANEWKGNARFTAGFNNWRAMAAGGVSGGTDLLG